MIKKKANRYVMKAKSLYELKYLRKTSRAPKRVRVQRSRYTPIWDFDLPIEETLLFAFERTRRDMEEEI